VFGAFGLELEEMRAQVGIQLRAILQLRESERHREKRLKLDHPAGSKIAQKRTAGTRPAVHINNNGSYDQKSIVTVAKIWRPIAS
jgi:hypothetical protein